MKCWRVGLGISLEGGSVLQLKVNFMSVGSRDMSNTATFLFPQYLFRAFRSDGVPIDDGWVQWSQMEIIWRGRTF
jgi:hypothetical protein